jgi:hypothetical protein
MKNMIKKILNEQSDRLPFKFHEGGYLITANNNEGTQWLTQEEFSKLEGLNENIKEVYELEVHELQLRKKHHRGVMQMVMDKVKNDPDFNFKTKR